MSNCVCPARPWQTPAIKTTSDFLDVLGKSTTQTIAINKESLTHSFSDLKTGIAGEFLQKVSNYGKKLMIIGYFSAITSQNLPRLDAAGTNASSSMKPATIL